MPPHRAAVVAGLTAALLSTASALSFSPSGTARIEGHAAGTFGTLDDPAGFSGGLAWGPDGTAYTHDGARVLYRWDVRTGRALSRTVVTPPASLLGAKSNSGPRVRLERFRTDGAVRGPYFRASGYRGPQPYSTGFTLSGGRAVLGSLGDGGKQASGFSTNGAFLARVEGVGAEARARVVLFDTKGARPQARLTLPPGRVLDVEPSPDGELVAVLRSADGGKIDAFAPLVLDVVTRAGKVFSRPAAPAAIVRPEDEPQVHWVGAARVLTATPQATSPQLSSSGQRVALWDLTGSGSRWETGDGDLRDAVPSPDGTLFLTVRAGSVPEVRRVSDGSFVRALGAAVTASVPLTGGAALVAVDTGNGQGELRVVRPSGPERRLGGVGLAGIMSLAVSRDAATFAALRADTISVLDRAGRVLHTLKLPALDSRPTLAFAGPRTLITALDGGGAGALIWDTATGRALGGPSTLVPLPGGLGLRLDTRQPASGMSQRRLTGMDAGGRTLWQEPWHSDYRAFLASPDGRALARQQGRRVPGQSEPQSAYLYRQDARTGRAGPGVLLRTGNEQDPYRGLRLLGFAPDRRHALLDEVSGDGCGGASYGLRVADLAAAKEVALPAALTTGLSRTFGCGLPVPIPTAAFTPENALLVRDGNALTWWRPR